MSELLFDRYRRLKVLRGGMGVVFLCEDVATQKVVALKTFPPERLADAHARERFVAEASVWVEVGSHPHVVRAHIVRSVDQQVFVISDFIAPAAGADGSSLRAHLHYPLAPGRSIELALGIVRGMRWACERVPGLVHRDLKPENVLVGNDGRAKVCDFGLAIVRPEDADRSGTRGYMAPEQLLGHADQRSDIYAFGVILAEMLQAPVAALAPLVDACRAVDPGARPASWEQVEHALLAAWPYLRPDAPPPPPAPEQDSAESAILEAWSHHALAHALLDLGGARDAQTSFEQAIAAGRTHGASALEAAGWNGLGMALMAQGHHADAVSACDRSLDIKRTIGDRVGEARSLCNRGNAYMLGGRAVEALADFDAATAIFTETQRPIDIARTQLGTIAALLGQNRIDEALGRARTACDIFRAAGDRRYEGAALGSLGQLLRRTGDLEGALAASQAALACFRGVADRGSEARELSFQGHTLRAMKRMMEALDAFSESLRMAEELGDIRLVGSNAYALAEMTPPLPQFLAPGTSFATRAAAAYRTIGREDLARDADRMIAKFRAPG